METIRDILGRQSASSSSNRSYTHWGEIRHRSTDRTWGNMMKKLAVAVAATALLGPGCTAEQAAEGRAAQTPAAPATIATAGPTTRLGPGPSTKLGTGVSTAMSSE